MFGDRMISTVLIVDSMATNRIVMKVKLGVEGYRTLAAPDAEGCLDLVRREHPDLILLDYDLPSRAEGGQGGIDLLSALREEPQGAKALIVVLAAHPDDAARLAALRAGADEFFVKSVDDQILFARLRSLMRGQESSDTGTAQPGPAGYGLAEPVSEFHQPGLVAIVMGRPERALHWRHALASKSTDRFVCLPLDQVFRTPEAGGPMPDVYLIDACLSEDWSGLKMMSALLSRPETRHAKVCVFDDGDVPELPAMAFDFGAADLVSTAQSTEEIALRLSRLAWRKREEDRLRASVKDKLRLAMIDPLTGIANRRAGLAELAQIAERSAASGQPFALMVLDLDRFKSVNDRYGHAAGDTVLVEVARRLTSCLRAGDLIARIGGEEFLVCLPDAGLADSRRIAERLCEEIEARPVPVGAREPLKVTISIGLALGRGAVGEPAADLVREVFDRADRALLTAKVSGRNQVTISRNAA